MLTEQEVIEIKVHLEKSQNPIFFFDNDPDGLCSFLLLQRFLGRGKGVPIRSFPALDESYFQKVEEFSSDYIFILDKPMVSKEFLEKVEQHNIPIVWIDHHAVEEVIPNFVQYYNIARREPSSDEPVTALCYQITQRKEDQWIAVVGCLADRYLPGFYNDFLETYPDLGIVSDDAFEIFYRAPIGHLAQILSFALKDRTSNVMQMLKFLLQATSPQEVLEDTPKNHQMHYRFQQIHKRYDLLIKKAELLAKESSGRLLFFQYGGETSMSADVSNYLHYRFQERAIAVVYNAGVYANISLRGTNIKPLALAAMKELPDSSGGGHDDAVGVKIRFEDLEMFKERLEDGLEKRE